LIFGGAFELLIGRKKAPERQSPLLVGGGGGRTRREKAAYPEERKEENVEQAKCEDVSPKVRGEGSRKRRVLLIFPGGENNNRSGKEGAAVSTE